MTKKAIIVGASGLIGSKLLAILLVQPDYKEVLLIARKKTKSTSTKLTQLVIDFDTIDDHAAVITGDVLFCCIGTTKDTTPDLNEYRTIDHDYPLKLAHIAAKNGIEQLHIVSSVGANAGSSSFYLKMKGETEDDLKKVGLKGLFIYQPSFLIGRIDNFRFAEKTVGIVMKIIGPLLIGGLKKYKAIQAIDVAKAMYKQSLKNQTGVCTYTFDKIKQRA